MNQTIEHKQTKHSKPTIESITIEHIVETNPDTSFLGEYTNDSADAIKLAEFTHSREYQYFKPAQTYNEIWQWYHKNGYSRGNCDFYARQQRYADFRRMESLQRGDFDFIGIIAKCEVKYSIGNNNYRLEHFTSGGLWGIESDSEQKYIDDIEREQLQDLKEHLQTFNINVKNFDKITIEHAESYEC